MYDEIKDELFQLIETEMSDGEEQLFMKSYKLFLQYGSNNKEFVINFDIVWNWVGYTKIGDAKKMLIKYFTQHNDYEISFAAVAEKVQFGRPKETILLTVDCFKNFCMKAGTTRANEVRQYYIKMENILHKYIQSKFLELRYIPLFKKVEPNNFVLLQLPISNTYSLVLSPRIPLKSIKCLRILFYK